jgi:hypothetical protein
MHKTHDQEGVNYEASEDTTDEVAAALLSQIEWHPYERAYRCFAR